jgi:catechol 2,3-dioxygenase-like lactoylglutathione lyase family enzyme
VSGIVFFATTDLDRVVEFYRETFDADVWVDQGDCAILIHDGFKFGFCERDETDDCGTLTFYYGDRAAVDDRYDALASRAQGSPVVNDDYDIYQFFAEDPDGRTVEVQTFLHPLPDEE